MVNEIRSPLLETLQHSSAWVSGEFLRRQFHVSRVAIWKHIEALRSEGYPIESGHRGYRLIRQEDNLSSLDFPPSEGIHFYRELESTMIAAREAMESVAEEDFLILAEHQSGGIGRGEKGWQSPRGGVYMTCGLKRRLLLNEAALIPFRGTLAILQALERQGVPEARFRWPGDIVIGDRKIGGILEEYRVRGGQTMWFTLGIGLHINEPPGPPLENDGMGSVAELTGRRLSRKALIREFRQRWKACLSSPPGEICRSLSGYAPFLDGPVRVEAAKDGVLRGKAESLDSLGGLNLDVQGRKLRLTTGETITFTTIKEEQQ